MKHAASIDTAKAFLKLVAAEALPQLLGSLVIDDVHCTYESTLAEVDDVVSVPAPNASDDKWIALNRHVEAAFQVPDLTKVLAVPELLAIYMQPAIDVLKRSIEDDIANVIRTSVKPSPIWFVTRRLPKPSMGTGCVAEYAETQKFGIRVVMSYRPSSPCQMFIINMLYGVGA